jgi:poly-gamma-glutamate synthesis protein (capsule biosynthesis protein)
MQGSRRLLVDAAGPDARIVNLETSITRSGDHDPQKSIHYRGMSR